MSNLENKIEFAEEEHKNGFHTTFVKHCYECEKQKADSINQKLYRAFPSDNEALHNPYGENYPLGVNPNDF